MSKRTAATLSAHNGGVEVRMFTAQSWQQQGLGRLNLHTLSQEAKTRLKWIEWHTRNGSNVSLTCRRFGIGRTTFYRWLKRYQPHNVASLEDRPSRPKRIRKPSWTTAEVLAVKRLRERYPVWGKMKLKVLLAREGVLLSASKVGRILSLLKRRGELKEPLKRSLRRRRRGKRPYATRKPRDYVARAPGDIVQVDTMDVRPEPGVVLKQFTAVDVVSRWSVATVASGASATLAKRALAQLLERTPYPIKAIQVDGGSEFMADFEEDCRERGLRLFVLPPRSPKLNGAVERANRTYREEFYECSDAPPTVEGFRPALRHFEHIYNFVRPHQSLDYQTPAEGLVHWATTNKEVSRTC